MKIQKIAGWFIILALVVAFGAFANTLPGTDLSQLDAKEQKLMQQLEDKNVDKRMQAAEKLVAKNCKKAETALVKMMQDDPVYQARIVAALSLMKLDCKDSVAEIDKQAKADDNKIVRNALLGIVNQMQ